MVSNVAARATSPAHQLVQYFCLYVNIGFKEVHFGSSLCGCSVCVCVCVCVRVFMCVSICVPMCV